MTLAEHLKDPLSGRSLNAGASIMTFLTSIPVNALFQKESLIGLAGWVRQTAGGSLTAEASRKLAEIQGGATFSFASRLPYGLLMTAFVMFFLIPVFKFGRKTGDKRTWREALKDAFTALLVPVLLLAVSSLCMGASFLAGVVLAMLAVAACVSTLVLEAHRNGWNGWLAMAWAASFLLITVVMLTNNHVVTMFG